MTERDQPSLQPNELPPELAAFLEDQEYACLLQATDQGTVFVVKAPGQDIQSLGGNVPVRVLHQLYDYPQAPVIRTVITWYDQPQFMLKSLKRSTTPAPTPTAAKSRDRVAMNAAPSPP